MPEHDVVSLAPGWRAITAGEGVSAIPGGEPGALARSEQTVIATHVDALAIIIELDADDTVFADIAADGLEAHGIRGAFDVSAA